VTDAESRLADDRANRKAARGLFDSRLAQVKADLAARSVPGRIKAKATDEVAKGIEQGVTIAKESKGIIAGTAAALALWFFREPLWALGQRLIAGKQDSVQEQVDTGGEAREELEPSE
jgi:hypothetical protein